MVRKTKLERQLDEKDILIAKKDAQISAKETWNEMQRRALVILVSVMTCSFLFNLHPLGYFFKYPRDANWTPLTYVAVVGLSAYLAYQFHKWFGGLIEKSCLPQPAKYVLKDRGINESFDFVSASKRQQEIEALSEKADATHELPQQAEVATALLTGATVNAPNMESVGNA